jgi:hypothetical protein
VGGGWKRKKEDAVKTGVKTRATTKRMFEEVFWLGRRFVSIFKLHQLPIATTPGLTWGTFRFEQIKLKVHKDPADLERDSNREELLQFLNSSY